MATKRFKITLKFMESPDHDPFLYKPNAGERVTYQIQMGRQGQFSPNNHYYDFPHGVPKVQINNPVFYVDLEDDGRNQYEVMAFADVATDYSYRPIDLRNIRTPENKDQARCWAGTAPNNNPVRFGATDAQNTIYLTSCVCHVSIDPSYACQIEGYERRDCYNVNIGKGRDGDWGNSGSHDSSVIHCLTDSYYTFAGNFSPFQDKFLIAKVGDKYIRKIPEAEGFRVLLKPNGWSHVWRKPPPTYYVDRPIWWDDPSKR